MAIKIQKKTQTITPFAGISFIDQEFIRFGLSDLIDKLLDVRNLTGYLYRDLYRTW